MPLTRDPPYRHVISSVCEASRSRSFRAPPAGDGFGPKHDLSGTARTDCRPRHPSQPPLAVSRQSYASPIWVLQEQTRTDQMWGILRPSVIHISSFVTFMPTHQTGQVQQTCWTGLVIECHHYLVARRLPRRLSYKTFGSLFCRLGTELENARNTASRSGVLAYTLG